MAQDPELTVCLRPLQRSDATEITRLLESDEEGISWTARIPWPFTLADAHTWLDRVLGSEDAFAIAAAGEFAGCTGLQLSPDPARVEIGYWVGQPYRSKGVASRAVGLLLQHASRRGFRIAAATVFPGNDASIRVLSRYGFLHVGEEDMDVPLRGGIRRVLKFERALPERHSTAGNP